MKYKIGDIVKIASLTYCNKYLYKVGKNFFENYSQNVYFNPIMQEECGKLAKIINNSYSYSFSAPGYSLEIDNKESGWNWQGWMFESYVEKMLKELLI